jgi:hypothetical protein
MLNISSADGEFIQPNTETDGRFAVYGLPAGHYRVAASAFMRESRPAEIEITADAEPPTLRLVVLPNRELKGIVKSAFGPVAGANVSAFATDVPPVMTPIFDTDERGMFSAILPPGAEQLDVLIEPPGFALRLFHIHWEKRQLVVTVVQNGGTLTIDGIAPSDAVLMHGGATMPLITVASWVGSSSANNRTSIPMLEPGMYAVCPARDRTACASGYLPPMGTLELKIEKARTAHGTERVNTLLTP